MPKKASTHQKHTHLHQDLGKPHTHTQQQQPKTPIPISTPMGQSLAVAPILSLVCVGWVFF